jgi:hypothetical protein
MTGLSPDLFAEAVMNPRPYALQAKPAIIIMDCAPGWKFVGQGSPGATGTVEVQDGVNNLSHVDLARSTAGFRWWNPGFYELPLLIRQITGIWCPFHILLYRLDIFITNTFHTRSKISAEESEPLYTVE